MAMTMIDIDVGDGWADGDYDRRHGENHLRIDSPAHWRQATERYRADYDRGYEGTVR